MFILLWIWEIFVKFINHHFIIRYEVNSFWYKRLRSFFREWKKKNEKKRAEKTNINAQDVNIRENDYENWINSNLNDVNINAKNENKHESSDSLMKDIRFTLLMSDG
jgi:hypothetical protein